MIKSDGWIIRASQEKGMIEPFEAKQVKVIETPSGPKPVISYGVSSYGYDIRVRGAILKMLDPQLSSSPAASGRGSMDSPPVTAGNDR